MIENSAKIKEAVATVLKVKKRLDAVYDGIDDVSYLLSGEELAEERKSLWKARIVRAGTSKTTSLTASAPP
jgi:hypothetical protein